MTSTLASAQPRINPQCRLISSVVIQWPRQPQWRDANTDAACPTSFMVRSHQRHMREVVHFHLQYLSLWYLKTQIHHLTSLPIENSQNGTRSSTSLCSDHISHHPLQSDGRSCSRLDSRNIVGEFGCPYRTTRGKFSHPTYMYRQLADLTIRTLPPSVLIRSKLPPPLQSTLHLTMTREANAVRAPRPRRRTTARNCRRLAAVLEPRSQEGGHSRTKEHRG